MSVKPTITEIEKICEKILKLIARQQDKDLKEACEPIILTYCALSVFLSQAIGNLKGESLEEKAQIKGIEKSCVRLHELIEIQYEAYDRRYQTLTSARLDAEIAIRDLLKHTNNLKTETVN